MSSADNMPTEIMDAAREIVANLLPTKSRDIYEIAYNRFTRWCQEKSVNSFPESVLLAYFADLAKTLKPPSLWSQYSMLKATLNIKTGTDIEKYTKLKAYLKKMNVGYIPKKSKVLSFDEVEKFLKDAPDMLYLMMKVVVIFGLCGACRSHELTNIKVEDIEETSSGLLVKIEKTKTNKPRSFIIVGKLYIDLYKKYVDLRPENFQEKRLFIKYNNGKCFRQVVGIHKIGAISKEIANYLKLEDSHLYTGHCFRRTSATLLVENEADITTLKRHGGWKSDCVAEGYIEDSITRKEEVARKIMRLNEPITISAAEVTEELADDNELVQNISQTINNRITTTNTSNKNLEKSLITFNQSCTNCTFNINIKN